MTDLAKQNLFEQVKGKLNITWDDKDTNGILNKIINSAIPALIHKLGIVDKEFDFSADGLENTLFLAYCLYDFNHVLNEFDDNYSNLIAQVRAIHEVQYYLNSEETKIE